MTDKPRLIEVAFPLKQTSIDSVHEKNVRPGHISTLHIWLARRPSNCFRGCLLAKLDCVMLLARCRQTAQTRQGETHASEWLTGLWLFSRVGTFGGSLGSLGCEIT